MTAAAAPGAADGRPQSAEAAAAEGGGGLEHQAVPPQPCSAGGASPLPAAAAAAAVRIAPLTLCISSPELEAAFWEDRGLHEYVARDRFSLLFLAANSAAAAWVARRHRPGGRPFSDACAGAPQWLALGQAAMLALALAAGAMLAAAPARYRAAREWLALAQWVGRSGLMLAVHACTSPAAWLNAAGRPPPCAHAACAAAAAAAGGDGGQAAMRALLQRLALLGAFPATQTLLFAVRIRVAAPLSAALALLFLSAWGGLACGVRASEALSGAAVAACSSVHASSNWLGLVVGAPGPYSAAQPLCSEAAPELLLAMTAALAWLMPATLLYCQELRLKASFLHARLPALRMAGHDVQLPSPVSVLLPCVLCVLGAAHTAAEAVLLPPWGWRFAC
ncbi:hypothetical protein Rsub_07368 [Raphidocelis subcapitata]|uniref:Uncharacterized protein n=1 Tax=Raphidocelis subcapitata TaxID=307507 RepID=A0A2V0P6S9_9CHLO|nr:hypothetical protein Rsub_07368 [Raphidocelis subcapitata]|eukprot:GBF94632.1 hypothetical protein Rsub_07368 [Raphidocelis subcapitata]